MCYLHVVIVIYVAISLMVGCSFVHANIYYLSVCDD